MHVCGSMLAKLFRLPYPPAYDALVRNTQACVAEQDDPQFHVLAEPSFQRSSKYYL
ncbi:hypothetical protein QFZ58_006826 [Streptomyces sp. B1I3]|nr:hypothetical protein [Streptomyces sp. B1I3]